MSGGEEPLMFGCPWNNVQEGRPMEWSGSYPRQLCHVCGLGAQTHLVDEDPRPGVFAGIINFGPAAVGGLVKETSLHGYRIYVVSGNGTKLGGPVATVPKRLSPPRDECCSGDVYRVRVEVQLTGERAAFARFGIFVMVGGSDLPVGAQTKAIMDMATTFTRTATSTTTTSFTTTSDTATATTTATVTTTTVRGVCAAPVCTPQYILAPGASICAAENCTEEECCVPAGTCGTLVCDSTTPPLYMPKIDQPAYCASTTCAFSECCEVSQVVGQNPEKGLASSVVVVVIAGIVLLLIGLVCLCCKFRGGLRSRTKVRPLGPIKEQDLHFNGVASTPYDEPAWLDARNLEAADTFSAGHGVAASLEEAEKRAHEVEAKRRNIEAAGMIERCMLQLRHAGPKEEEDCCGLLLGIIQSVQSFPEELRYRRVDRRNEVLARRFFTVQGAEGLLEAAGWRQDPFGPCFKLGIDAPFGPLDLVADALETRLGQLWEEQWETQVPSIFVAETQNLRSQQSAEAASADRLKEGSEQKKCRPVSAKARKHKRESHDGPGIYEESDDTVSAHQESWDEPTPPPIVHPECEHPPEQLSDELEDVETGEPVFRQARCWFRPNE